jgi:hypothetical protein
VLISLHLPKTAGTSFRSSLESQFGDALVADYSDRPLHHPAPVRNLRALRGAVGAAFSGRLPGASERTTQTAVPQCVHGHFLPLKYRFLRTGERKFFITWLRDPVQRLVSHYDYWQRSYDADSALAIHRRMIEEEWSLERFALGPELRNIYHLFLWGFPPERFDFIGITEYYEAEMQRLAENIVDLTDRVFEDNVGSGGRGRQYEIDPALESRIRAHHRRDQELYDRALKLRDDQLKGQVRN